MQVTFRQNLADLQSASRFFEQRLKKRRRWPLFFRLWAGMFFAMPLLAAFHTMRPPLFAPRGAPKVSRLWSRCSSWGFRFLPSLFFGSALLCYAARRTANRPR